MIIYANNQTLSRLIVSNNISCFIVHCTIVIHTSMLYCCEYITKYIIKSNYVFSMLIMSIKLCFLNHKLKNISCYFPINLEIL